VKTKNIFYMGLDVLGPLKGFRFEDKMKRLTGQLNEQFGESEKMEAAIRMNLKHIGFEMPKVKR
jgi:hypothetical protein